MTRQWIQTLWVRTRMTTWTSMKTLTRPILKSTKMVSRDVAQERVPTLPLTPITLTDHDPDVSDEVAKQRAAARARAIMGKKRREAAAFDKQVQAERQAAMAAKGNVDEQRTCWFEIVVDHTILTKRCLLCCSHVRIARLSKPVGCRRPKHRHSAQDAASPTQGVSGQRSFLVGTSL